MFSFANRALPHGPAPAAALSAPGVEVVTDAVRDGTRELVLRLRSARGAPAVGLWIAADGPSVRAAEVQGRQVPVHGRIGSWEFGVVLEGTPWDGAEIRLLLERAGPVELRVGDRTDDLGVVPGFSAPTQRVLVTRQVWALRTVRL